MSVKERLDALETARDYAGAGNLFLDVLMKRHQETQPDADALLLEKRAPTLIRKKFQLPHAATCPSVFRGQHIAAEDRGSWCKDHYVDLIITSFLLGASRYTLPSPHDQLVQYYRDTALEQERVLLQLTTASNNKKPKISAFAERVAALQAAYEHRKAMLETLGLDPETLERLQEAEDIRYRKIILSLGD